MDRVPPHGRIRLVPPHERREQRRYAVILDAYAKEGVVTPIPLEGKLEKNNDHVFDACVDYLNDHRDRFDPSKTWMMTHDADEFLFINAGGHDSVHDAITRLSRLNDNRAQSLKVPTLLFGSSGHDTFEPGLLIDRFTHRFDIDSCSRRLSELRDEGSRPSSTGYHRRRLDEKKAKQWKWNKGGQGEKGKGSKARKPKTDKGQQNKGKGPKRQKGNQKKGKEPARKFDRGAQASDWKKNQVLSPYCPDGSTDGNIRPHDGSRRRSSYDNVKSVSLVSSMARECYELDGERESELEFCAKTHLHTLVDGPAGNTEKRGKTTGRRHDPRYADAHDVGEAIVLVHYVFKSRQEFYRRACSSVWGDKYFARIDAATAVTPETYFDFRETYTNNLEDTRMAQFSSRLERRLRDSSTGASCDTNPVLQPLDYYQECFKLGLEKLGE